MRGCGAEDVPGQDHFCQKSPGILLCALIDGMSDNMSVRVDTSWSHFYHFNFY